MKRKLSTNCKRVSFNYFVKSPRRKLRCLKLRRFKTAAGLEIRSARNKESELFIPRKITSYSDFLQCWAQQIWLMVILEGCTYLLFSRILILWVLSVNKIFI